MPEDLTALLDLIRQGQAQAHHRQGAASVRGERGVPLIEEREVFGKVVLKP
jgi:hypothetical protein